MSFILEEGPLSEGSPREQEAWLATRDTIDRPLPAYQYEHIEAKDAERLRRTLISLWIINGLLQGLTLTLVILASILSRRGRESMWLLAVALINTFILALALGIGIWGMRGRNERLIKHCSSMLIALCCLLILEWCFELLYVLVVSRRSGVWQKHGTYTPQEIWEYNSWILGLMLVDLLSITFCYTTSHKAWQLAKTLEMQRQTEAEKLKSEAGAAAYGTFGRKEGR
ncbi:transmembrane protein [Cystoisospora suis]|uniref:Transmembrane protein n=1 Tax=Cystoisospora suis TaxID=483139 RepID=A0A2C6LFX9_9APIC|nr:transmembrane protein [Cystoisospora suis]